MKRYGGNDAPEQTAGAAFAAPVYFFALFSRPAPRRPPWALRRLIPTESRRKIFFFRGYILCFLHGGISLFRAAYSYAYIHFVMNTENAFLPGKFFFDGGYILGFLHGV